MSGSSKTQAVWFDFVLSCWKVSESNLNQFIVLWFNRWCWFGKTGKSNLRSRSPLGTADTVSTDTVSIGRRRHQRLRARGSWLVLGLCSLSPHPANFGSFQHESQKGWRKLQESDVRLWLSSVQHQKKRRKKKKNIKKKVFSPPLPCGQQILRQSSRL